MGEHVLDQTLFSSKRRAAYDAVELCAGSVLPNVSLEVFLASKGSIAILTVMR